MPTCPNSNFVIEVNVHGNPCDCIVSDTDPIEGTGPAFMTVLRTLHGHGISSGIATGVVRHGHSVGQESAPADVILVTRCLEPDLINCISIVNAVISEKGGALCHAAIILRDFQIPVVVGVDDALSLLKENTRVTVDADNGQITILE